MRNVVSGRLALAMVAGVALTTLVLTAKTPASPVVEQAAQRAPGNQKPVSWLGNKMINLKPVDQHLSDPALVGAIDLHAHLNPDSSGGGQEPRAIDAIDNARMMKARGARGYVFKTHMDITSAASVYFARKAVPGPEIFARFAMNTPSGGLNPAAAYQFTHIAGGYGRIIEFPTRDSTSTVAGIMKSGTENRPWVMGWTKFFPNMPTGIAVAKGGQLVPEAKAMIAYLATLKTLTDAPIVMATGHATTEEHMLLAREGRRLGVTTLLTHPDSLSNDQAAEMAKLGAYIEVNASGGFAHGADAETWAPKTVARIQKIGSNMVVMGSDAGQMDRPLPGDELSMAAKALRAHGLSEEDLNNIFKNTPAKVLGLPAKAAQSTAAR